MSEIEKKEEWYLNIDYREAKEIIRNKLQGMTQNFIGRQKVKRNKIDTGEEIGRGQECSDPVRGDEGRNKRSEETDS